MADEARNGMDNIHKIVKQGNYNIDEIQKSFMHFQARLVLTDQDIELGKKLFPLPKISDEVSYAARNGMNSIDKIVAAGNYNVEEMQKSFLLFSSRLTLTDQDVELGKTLFGSYLALYEALKKDLNEKYPGV